MLPHATGQLRWSTPREGGIAHHMESVDHWNACISVLMRRRLLLPVAVHNAGLRRGRHQRVRIHRAGGLWRHLAVHAARHPDAAAARAGLAVEHFRWAVTFVLSTLPSAAS